MQSCAPTQSAFSYPLSFRRLCQHSFPLPLPATTAKIIRSAVSQAKEKLCPCPTGTPTFAALRRQRRDLIIANPVEANTPTVAGQAVAEASAPVNAGTVLLTDSDDRCTPPASTHRQIRTCPPRAKGSLDRRSKRLSFPHFFLRRKKCGRRRPPPRQGKIDSPPQRRNPPRAKGSLNRRFEWFSLVTSF